MVGCPSTLEVLLATRHFLFRPLFSLVGTVWLLLAGMQQVRNVGDLARFGALAFQLVVPLELVVVMFPLGSDHCRRRCPGKRPANAGAAAPDATAKQRNRARQIGIQLACDRQHGALLFAAAIGLSAAGRGFDRTSSAGHAHHFA